MTSYDSLTDRGKARRLQKVAEAALAAYDIDVQRIRFFMIETNTLFRVDARSGERFILRIYTDLDSTLQENSTELFWLNTLRRDTDLRVVEPVARRDGAYLSVVSVDGAPPQRRCALFRWIPGHNLDDERTPHNMRSLGECMAKLHDHAEGLSLPAELRPKRWDRIFYYPNEPVVFREEAHRVHFPPERRALMEEMMERCAPVLEGLYAAGKPPILIHGDLQFWNVRVFRGRLTLLDFEDVMLAYPVQDIAVTLYYRREAENYKELCAAFREGYTRLRPWPVESDSQLATLMAARSTNFLNYMAHHEPEPEEDLAGLTARLRGLLEIIKGNCGF